MARMIQAKLSYIPHARLLSSMKYVTRFTEGATEFAKISISELDRIIDGYGYLERENQDLERKYQRLRKKYKQLQQEHVNLAGEVTGWGIQCEGLEEENRLLKKRLKRGSKEEELSNVRIKLLELEEVSNRARVVDLSEVNELIRHLLISVCKTNGDTELKVIDLSEINDKIRNMVIANNISVYERLAEQISENISLDLYLAKFDALVREKRKYQASLEQVESRLSEVD